MVNELLSNGANPFAVTISRWKNPGIHLLIKKAQQWIKNENGGVNVMDQYSRTAMYFAVAEGVVRRIKELRIRGADTGLQSAYGQTAVHVAIFEFHGPRVVKALVDRFEIDGVAVVADLKALLKRDNEGNTPLHVAILGNNREAFDILVPFYKATDFRTLRNGLAYTPLECAERLAKENSYYFEKLLQISSKQRKLHKQN